MPTSPSQFRSCLCQNFKLDLDRRLLCSFRTLKSGSTDLLSDGICFTKRALDRNVVIQMSLQRSFVPRPTQHFSKEMRFIRSFAFVIRFISFRSLWFSSHWSCPFSSCRGQRPLLYCKTDVIWCKLWVFNENLFIQVIIMRSKLWRVFRDARLRSWRFLGLTIGISFFTINISA